MKTPSEELHQLIHSLGQNEKRYLMLQAKNGERSYHELFRFVNAQPIYDEERIRFLMKKRNVVQFKKLKHYTYQNTLRGLENFFASSSDEIIVLRKLIQTEILFDKKLFSQAKKNIISAMDIAERKDLLFFKINCYEWFYRLSVASGKPQEVIHEIDTRKVKKAVLDCGRWLELKHLNTLFWNFIHTSSEIVTQGEKKLLGYISKEAVLIDKQASSGYTIKREVYLLLGLAFRFNKQLDESYIYRKKLISLLESDKRYIYERAYAYISALGMLINICREMNKSHHEMAEVYEKAKNFMRHVPKKYFNLRLDESCCNLFNNYVTYLFVNKKYDEVIQQGEELMRRIKKHSAVFQNSLLSILYQNLMYSYFFRKDYKTSMKYHHLHLKCHDLDQKKNKKDYICRKLFGLVLLFEMGDRDALYYQCRSLQYYFQKNRKQEVAEMILVKAFSGPLQKKYSQREMRSDFSKLYFDMKKYSKHFEEILKAHKFDYMKWAQNKTGISK